MQLNFVYIWLGLMTVLTLIVPLSRKARRKNDLASKDFVVAGLAVWTAITLFKVVFTVLTKAQLKADLGDDGVIILCIGSALGIYYSLREVVKLF
jgi:hypothetical protein